MHQPTLFRTTRFEQWAQFHRENPHVWDVFLAMTRRAVASGRKVGARCVWERMRWELDIETQADDFRLNDHLVPYYARLVMLRNPELDGYFERRDARFDVDDATLLREADVIDSARQNTNGDH